MAGPLLESKLDLGNGITLTLLDESLVEEYFQIIDGHRKEISLYDDFVNRLVRNPEEALISVQKHLELVRTGESLTRAILVDGELAGRIMVNLNPRLKSAELGYMVAPPFQGRHITSTVTSFMVHHLFKKLGYVRVWLTCDPENGASMRIAEKLGMTLDGTDRWATLRANGTYADSARWSIIRPDWDTRRPA